nr:hypothetical protein BdHM001_34880 [Bdellovibrio sp. HM001]
MSKKVYPLDIENVGEETYILMSRGHHDFETFMDEVTKSYPNWSMGEPQHLWVKAVPTRKDGYRCVYAFVSATTRGAFPITHCQEDCDPSLKQKRIDRLTRLYPAETRPAYIQALINRLSGVQS